MSEFEQYIASLTERGGPQEHEFGELTDRLGRAFAGGGTVTNAPPSAISSFGEAISESTMQGFAYQKPHGYAGDFEIIDRIYESWHSPVAKLVQWDKYFHAQAAPQAVRNRKQYFKAWIKEQVAARGSIRVLNVASGPARDVSELLAEEPNLPVHFHCVDQDEVALEYAASQCKHCEDKVTFERRTVLRLMPETKFDIVWSAGLFDYLPDRIFVRILARMQTWLVPGGELAIGNFSPENPTRAYMDFMEWVLIHRTPDALMALAMDAGFNRGDLRVEMEPLAVNLFMHARA